MSNAEVNYNGEISTDLSKQSFSSTDLLFGVEFKALTKNSDIHMNNLEHLKNFKEKSRK